jgi:hypothetical protein
MRAHEIDAVERLQGQHHARVPSPGDRLDEYEAARVTGREKAIADAMAAARAHKAPPEPTTTEEATT